MLDDSALADAARRLLAAERDRQPIRQLSLQYPEMTIEDAYRVQRALTAAKLAEGRTVRARKIGLTSRAMQQAVSITEPDYGVIFDDMFFDDGGVVPFARFIRPRVEVELAFILDRPLKGPGVTTLDVLDATRWVTPALEILDARIQMSDPETGHLRTIVDTISDNAADAGIVVGGRAVRPDALDLRRVGAALYINEAIEETGLAAGVLGHPANGVAWLANKLAPYDEYLQPGQVILAGSFTRPVFVGEGDTVHADFGDLGERDMPVPLSQTAARWRAALAGERPVTGMWVVSGSPVVAEICAGSGVDWLLIDSEHAPNDLHSILAQLHAVAPYPVTPVVRPPVGDPVLIKQLLDLGVEVLLIPMVESAAQARALVAATRYPPDGIRGVGSALARASRWNRVGGYLKGATQTVSLLVQIESRAGLDALPEIAAVDGIDGIFLGPADLAASLGHLGEQAHPEVTGAVEQAIKAITAARKPAGVNAFPRDLAERYLAAGARFILVGADVTLLAAGSEELAARHRRTD